MAGLMLIGLALRLPTERGLWLDEAITVAQARLPLAQLLATLKSTDIHPPGYLLIQWLNVRILGVSELAVRFPSIIAGVALIPVLYFAGRELYGRRTALMAAALATLAPLAVWYSQEARMYALLLLPSVGAVLYQVKAVRYGRTSDWIFYALCSASMLWIHYFAVLQVITQQLAFGAVVWRTKRPSFLRKWALSIAVTGVALIPIVLLLRSQLAGSPQLDQIALPSRSPTMTGLSVYSILTNMTWALWGYHSARLMRQLVALWPLMILLSVFLLGRIRRPITALVLGIALIPMASLFFAGLKLRDLFEIRYFVVGVPMLILFAAYLSTRASSTRASVGFAGLLLLGTMALGLADQQLNQGNPRLYDFRSALIHVNEKAVGNTLVLYAPRYLDSVVEYYAPDVKSAPLDDPPEEMPDHVVIITSLSLSDRLEPPAESRASIRQITQSLHDVDRRSFRQVEVLELK